MPHSKSSFYCNPLPLHLFQDTLLELPLHLLARLVRGRLAVEGEQAAQVELRLLQQLDLADVDLNCTVSIFTSRMVPNLPPHPGVSGPKNVVFQRTFWRG